MLHDWMVSQGLQQSQVDQCLYFLPGKLWVTFWVDDFLVMGSDRAKRRRAHNLIEQARPLFQI